MDSNPLAPDMEKVMAGREEAFKDGLAVISRLTDGPLFLCKAEGSAITAAGLKQVVEQEFAGPHPAGLAGTHIHFLDPVDERKTVWHIGLQDVIAIGRLFTTGKLDTERIIAIGGPSLKKPRLLRTRTGACLDQLLQDEMVAGENRVVSGSVLSGRKAHGSYAYLGKFHQQVSVLPEERERKLFGWFSLSGNLHSVKNILWPKKGKIPLTTARNGSPRAMVPVGSYEKVMPLDILPTYLLRALAVKDIEEAEALGCLELAEEDLALCSYVCPAKMDHGGNLRGLLTLIEKEG
jgi:Na+-transporting NADH:ubiquinone oxidoreductase subunit A